MATYTRAGTFSGVVTGAPKETALRVVDANGADAVLWATADKNKTVGPVVYANEAGSVTLYADPGTYTVKWTGGQTTVTVSGGTEDPSAAGTQANLTSTLDFLTTGEEVLPRGSVSDEYPLDSGTLHLSFFTARKSEPITQVATSVYSTAGASLTKARVGIYQSSGGTLTLLAASANDTNMWTAAFATNTKALSSTFSKVAGNRYALGVFAVGTTMPVLGCQLLRYQDAGRAPRIEGDLAAQTDLPTSISEASLADSYRRFQGILLP